MKITCIDKPTKFKNLSLGKEYEGREETDNYFITNDIGISAKYSKKYFRPVPTSIDVMENIDVEIDDSTITVTINNTVSGRASFELQHLLCCGLKEFSGIRNILHLINQLIAQLATNPIYINYSKAQLFNSIMNSVIEDIHDNDPCAFVIFSCISTDDTDDTVYNYMMEKANTSYTDGLNPNSNNIIQVYVYPI
jgi:hypothetical protein